MQVQGVIPLVFLNHLNAQRVVHRTNVVYNLAFLRLEFHYSAPCPKRCNRECESMRQMHSIHDVAGKTTAATPAGHQPNDNNAPTQWQRLM